MTYATEDLKCNQAIYGNIWIFTISLEIGGRKCGHKHEFDHIHQVISGSATIVCYKDIEGSEILYKKVIQSGKFYKVPKEHIHAIEADQGVPYIGHCMHALRHENGNVVETDMIQDIDNGEIEFHPDADK